jgi:adenine/guanine/hypoxanthine permease
MSTDPGTASNQKRTDIVAGLATFTAMSYIIFTNPAVLQPIGMAAGPVLLWTCVVAFAATATAGYVLGSPTGLACGMGLNLFLAQYAMQGTPNAIQGTANATQRAQIPWEHLLVTCLLVSIVVFLLSLAPTRRNLIAAIPPQIFAAIKAGVGGLLVKVSLTEIARVAGTKTVVGGEAIGLRAAIAAFLFGLAVILVTKGVYAQYVKNHPDNTGRQEVQLLDSSSLILSVIAMIPLCLWLHLSQQMTPVPGQFWIWNGADAPLAQLANGEYWIACVPFAIAVFFIMMMDIAGSPVEYVRKGNPGENLPAQSKNAIIRRSLLIDSSFNILAPLAGISPVVYYAENHVGWSAGGRSGWTAATVAAGFLVFALIGLMSIWHGWPISEWIPKFAVMPALFFVGLMIIAGSFALRFKPPAVAPAAADAAAATDAGAREPLGRVLFFLPAAITVVMVTNTSFDSAIAAGILSYALISSLPSEFVGTPESDLSDPDISDADRDRRARDLGVVYLGAVVVLVLNFLLAK